MAAMAAQIADELTDIPDLQVVGELAWFPTPPCIDIYPATEEFQQQQAFGVGNDTLSFTVRARVNTPDHEGAQTLLLSLVDPKADTSLQQAILADRTLDGAVTDMWISSGPSGYGGFPDVNSQNAFAYLGCTWTVTVVL